MENHRIVGAGKNLQISSSPTTLLQYGYRTGIGIKNKIVKELNCCVLDSGSFIFSRVELTSFQRGHLKRPNNINPTGVYFSPLTTKGG